MIAATAAKFALSISFSEIGCKIIAGEQANLLFFLLVVRLFLTAGAFPYRSDRAFGRRENFSIIPDKNNFHCSAVAARTLS